MAEDKLQFTQIKETALYVNDLEVTKSFYHGKLGLEIISHVPGKHIFFRAGTSVLLCFLPENSKEKTEIPPHFAYGDQHIAFEAEVNDYEKWKEKIKTLRISIEHEETWGGGKYESFYFRDPDNHSLEIVQKGMWGDIS